MRREDEEFRFGVGRNGILEPGRNMGAGALGVKFIFIDTLFGVLGWKRKGWKRQTMG